jgi:hypothetical protein
MLLIALSCLLRPCVTAMSVYVFTPFPPAHDHVVFQATVLPLALVTCAQSLPLAPEMPHWSSCSVYGPAAAVSHCPQCCVVSSAGVGAPSAAVHSEARRASLANMMMWGMAVERIRRLVSLFYIRGGLDRAGRRGHLDNMERARGSGIEEESPRFSMETTGPAREGDHEGGEEAGKRHAPGHAPTARRGSFRLREAEIALMRRTMRSIWLEQRHGMGNEQSRMHRCSENLVVHLRRLSLDELERELRATLWMSIVCKRGRKRMGRTCLRA